MMVFSLRPDLHYCRLADDYIFLCLRTCRYFLLRGRPAERFERFLSGHASESDLSWLVKFQIVAKVHRRRVGGGDRIRRPSSSYRDATIPPATLISVVSVLLAQRRVRRELTVRNLAEIIASLGSAKPATHEIDVKTSLGIAAAFHRARHYSPATDQCLVRGVAMKRMLLRRRCDARLVFGVAMPFSAHCWVQAGDLVLNDQLDAILPYKPILTI